MVKNLGKLSHDGLVQLSSQLQSIAKDARLIDENEGQPRCTDIPSVSVAAYVEGELKQISLSESCHQHSLEGGAGKQIDGFARTLLGY